MKFAERTKHLKESAVRNPLFDQPGMISFAAGKPENIIFPIERLKKLVPFVVENYDYEAFQYGNTSGMEPLIDFIKNTMMPRAGVIEETDILITSGSQQGIEYSARIFLNEGDTVICEEPSYTGAFAAFASYCPNYVGVPVEEDGMNIETLEKVLKEHPEAKIIYTIPDFQNPSGCCMSVEKREKLAKLAKQYEVFVIEDAPYRELVFEGKPYPSIKSFDTEGWVIYLGSFSKIFCPGLRIGWISASQKVIKKYFTVKQNIDLHCSTFDQLIIAEYFKKYDLDEHINGLKQVYRKKRDLIVDAIKAYFPADISYTVPNGGFFIWIKLKESIDASELLLKAAEKEKVVFLSGEGFFSKPGVKNYIRLGYSFIEKEFIEEGVKRLGRILSQN